MFTVQRFNNGQVQIQLIGDESLYGRNYIIEPNFDDGNGGMTQNPGYNGRNYTGNGRVIRTTTYEIAAWPLIRFIYLPSYHVWHSSWYWGYYPTYWSPGDHTTTIIITGIIITVIMTITEITAARIITGIHAGMTFIIVTNVLILQM